MRTYIYKHTVKVLQIFEAHTCTDFSDDEITPPKMSVKTGNVSLENQHSTSYRYGSIASISERY